MFRLKGETVMAHCEKFKLSDAKNVLKEYNRELSEYKNEVDKSKIPLNYVIGADNGADGECSRLHSRVQQLSYRKRKDTIGFCTWIVTCPEEFKDDELKQREFFKFVYNYTVRRYGYENVLNGYVHNDETSPHIHIPVIPSVQENGLDKLNAKKFLNKKELSAYHKDLEQECYEHFKIKGLILNGRTKGGYTLEELKQRTKDDEEMKRREQNVKDAEKALENQKTAFADEKTEFDGKVNSFKGFKNEVHNKIIKALGLEDKPKEERPKTFAETLDMLQSVLDGIKKREAEAETAKAEAEAAKEKYEKMYGLAKGREQLNPTGSQNSNQNSNQNPWDNRYQQAQSALGM